LPPQISEISVGPIQLQSRRAVSDLGWSPALNHGMLGSPNPINGQADLFSDYAAAASPSKSEARSIHSSCGNPGATTTLPDIRFNAIQKKSDVSTNSVAVQRQRQQRAIQLQALKNKHRQLRIPAHGEHPGLVLLRGHLLA
jgi:hypothetical protein